MRSSVRLGLVVGTAGAVAGSETEYSEKFKFGNTVDYAAVLIVSTAGSITVTQQCSLNGEVWYDPYDEGGNAIGQVCSALTVTTGKYIEFTPVTSPYIRFKVVEGIAAATVVTLSLTFQEDI